MRANNVHSTNDEGALKSKVQEAMSVYDDYIKTRGTNGEGQEEGSPAKENVESNA